MEITVDSFVKYGYKAVYCHNAIFYDEQPIDFKTSYNQRIRWICGTNQVIDAYGKKIFKKLFTKDWYSCYDILAHGCISRCATGISFLFFLLFTLVTLIIRGPLMALLIAAAYIVSLYITFWLMAAYTIALAKNRIKLSFLKKLQLTFVFPFYMLMFFPLDVIAICKKMLHGYRFLMVTEALTSKKIKEEGALCLLT